MLQRPWWRLLLLITGRSSLSILLALALSPTLISAQEGGVNTPEREDTLEAKATSSVPDGGVGSELESSSGESELTLLGLLIKGGALMIPIGLMGVLSLAMVIERLLGLREAKVLPPQLVVELGRLSTHRNGFDPKQAYRLCQDFPSAASTVLRVMLLKIGRPLPEVEHAVSEASDREATRLYDNVRWLNLSAAIAPLMGLFGTVWGMIQAFFQTTQMHAGQNKALFLAEGIYVALVTTLGGLAVAIPAAIFAHYFEGRIQAIFHRIDELVLSLLPQIERFEGRLRMSRPGQTDLPDELLATPMTPAATGNVTPPPVASPPAPRPSTSSP